MNVGDDYEGTHIEADYSDDADSALGDDQSNCTESLRSSILHSVYENGRGYHKYREGSYILPEDEREQERLDLQHELMLRTLHGRLSLVPNDVPFSNCLDLGCGTGIWAIDYADQHPETQVLGIDLSAIQPDYIPPNCKFEVDDYDSEWTYRQKFDFIRGGLLVTSLSDPTGLFRKAYNQLVPGGWFEMQDLMMPIACDDGTMDNTAWHRWNGYFYDAMKKVGRDIGWAAQYRKFFEDLGFQNIEEHIFKVPINSWPRDRALKDLGSFNLINMLEGLEAFTNRPFNRVLGMPMDEIELLLVDVRKDLQSKRIHSYWPV
ncbi:hypothetical protein BT93_L5227 [Corymbia citriodora subsp. variegata]|uniref:Methyltransferase n=1 Tax=Corymbia citriodora subsp. variegata TaxID=360336 RepID=A0A8T0CG90_CORYI|nr:hypothetical protein BT93_L5227 [Corymbia citriodora subsp. variegata]